MRGMKSKKKSVEIILAEKEVDIFVALDGDEYQKESKNERFCIIQQFGGQKVPWSKYFFKGFNGAIHYENS